MSGYITYKLVPALDRGCNIIDSSGREIDPHTLFSMLREKPIEEEPRTSFLTTKVALEPQVLKGARALVYDVDHNGVVVGFDPDGARLLRQQARYTGRL